MPKRSQRKTRSKKRTQRKSGSKKRTRKSGSKKRTRKSGSKKRTRKSGSKKRTRKSGSECNIKRRPNTKQGMIQEIRDYVVCVERLTDRNQDMELSRLKTEPVSNLKKFLKFYRNNY